MERVERERRSQQLLRDAREEAGLCIQCGIEAPAPPRKTGQNCIDRMQNLNLANWMALRANVLVGYGSICACCGETEESFLNLDHIVGKRGEDATKAYRRAIDEDYPPDMRLLCFNCNMGREHQPDKVCVHVTNGRL